MRLLKFVKVGVLVAGGSLVGAANASAYICDLTAVNSVCGPSSASPDTVTIGSGTYASVSGTKTGVGWDAPNSSLFDQGAIFAQINVQPTGTGVIDSFLRLQ